MGQIFFLALGRKVRSGGPLGWVLGLQDDGDGAHKISLNAFVHKVEADHMNAGLAIEKFIQVKPTSLKMRKSYHPDSARRSLTSSPQGNKCCVLFGPCSQMVKILVSVASHPNHSPQPNTERQSIFSSKKGGRSFTRKSPWLMPIIWNPGWNSHKVCGRAHHPRVRFHHCKGFLVSI